VEKQNVLFFYRYGFELWIIK